MSVHQKLGIILERKVVKKLSLEKNQLIFDIKIDFESTILALFDEP